MEEIPHESGTSDSGSSDVSWWPSDFTEKLKSVSLGPREESLSTNSSPCSTARGELTPHAASQVLWETGSCSGHIPNGFYTIIPDKKLKEMFDTIPSPDVISSMGLVGHRAEIILVDAEKDKKLSRLKQLSAALVKGQNSNPASIVKKIAGLVSDFYKRPSSDLSPGKASLEEISQLAETRGFQLLGQIRNGSCRPRAILFKVLADAVGLESKLLVGLPGEGASDWIDSYKHMSVVVVLNSVELLVDLIRSPGQLIPFSSKAFFINHISATGESDSAENDSCDSPLELNSPFHGLPDRFDGQGHEQDENLQSYKQHRTETSLNVVGPSTRNLGGRSSAFAERKLSSSHSEPNIVDAFWGRSRKKAVAQQRTASSSPEHPLFRARGRSMLSGDRHSIGEYSDGVAPSRSHGAAKSDVRRVRRRSISITPEIGDDIVRAVRAMNETLKQNHLLRDQGDEVSGSYSTVEKNRYDNQSKNVSSYQLGNHDEISRPCVPSRNEINSNQKATSLPSSPHVFGVETSDISGDSDMLGTKDCVSIWNKVVQSSPFLNKPLLPFQDWNIDFSELTVGIRVGIGFFGEVFRGIWNGTDVAIKVFLEQDLTAENMEDFCNEISILSRLRHPNGTDLNLDFHKIGCLPNIPPTVLGAYDVILFLGACMKPPHLSMVTEYMEMGSLYYLIHMSSDRKRLNWRRRLKMLRDICRGLMCIHRMKIVHRDIKSANCLVNKHWAVKICDFGLSRVITDLPMGQDSSAGTPEWIAPELIRQEPFTEKCDIFSLGVIMWELCTLKRPWEGTPTLQVVHEVANEGTRLEIPEGPLGKLIADCWAEPDERPSCQEILSRLLDCEYMLC